MAAAEGDTTAAEGDRVWVGGSGGDAASGAAPCELEEGHAAHGSLSTAELSMVEPSPAAVEVSDPMDVDAGASHPAAAQTTQTTQTAQAGQQPGAHEMMQLPAVLPLPAHPKLDCAAYQCGLSRMRSSRPTGHKGGTSSL